MNWNSCCVMQKHIPENGSLSRSPGASASKTDAGRLPKGRNGSITQSPGPAGRKEGNHVC